MKNKLVNFYALTFLLLSLAIFGRGVLISDSYANKEINTALLPPAKFYESFGHRFNKKWVVTGNPYMIIGLTDEVKARAGKYSARAVVGKDYGRTPVMRAESGLRTSYGYKWMKQIPVGESRWYGFSIFVPANFIPDVKGHQDIFFQLKDTDFRHLMLPVVALSIQEDHFNVTARGGELKKSSWTTEKSHDFGAVTPGKWNDFVVQVVIGEGEYGQLNIYSNGEHVFTYNGSVGRMDVIRTFSDELKPINKYRSYRAKIGLEKPEWRNPKEIQRSADIGIDYRVLYFDELRVTDGEDSYEIVNPARKKSNHILIANQNIKESTTFIKYGENRKDRTVSKKRKTKVKKVNKPINTVKSSTPIATNNNSVISRKQNQNNNDDNKKTKKEKKVKPSAKTTTPLKEVNSDGSPVIRQIELSITDAKAKSNKPVTIKWNVKGNGRSKCTRNGSWSGTSSASEGEYVVKRAQTHSRFEIVCGWGQGEVSKTLMLVPNPKQSKLQYDDKSIIFIEIE